MAPVLRDFHSEEVYRKKLTKSDMKESSRLYIKKSAARRICCQAFGCSSKESEQTCYKKDDLPFIDAGFNRLQLMVFQRRGNKYYLTGRWGDFVRAKKLREGDSIRIRELTPKSGTGEKFFMIDRRVKVRRVQIG